MNTCTLVGRLTRDPQTRAYGEEDKKMARFTLAVDRKLRRDDGQQTADFIGCVCYGKLAEFADNYLRQGTKIVLRGHINTGKYQNKDGQTVYTTDVIADEMEFAESKKSGDGVPAAHGNASPDPVAAAPADGSFVNVPEGIEEELPWN